MAGEDRAKDWRRVPNVAAPIMWQKGLDPYRDDEPMRHVGIEDWYAAKERQAQHEAERHEGR